LDDRFTIHSIRRQLSKEQNTGQEATSFRQTAKPSYAIDLEGYFSVAFIYGLLQQAMAETLHRR